MSWVYLNILIYCYFLLNLFPLFFILRGTYYFNCNLIFFYKKLKYYINQIIFNLDFMLWFLDNFFTYFMETTALSSFDSSFLSLFHHIDKCILVNLHLTYSSEFFLSFFISFQQLSLSTIVSTITFCCNVLFHMWDLLLCYCLCTQSSLNRYGEQLGRNLLFQFWTYWLAEIVCFLVMDQKCQCINRVVHDMDDHLHNIGPSETMVLILKRSIPMCDWLNFINKIDNNFWQRKLIF